jgi:hypothetical protein
VASALVVVGSVVIVTARARSRDDIDLAFGLCLVGTLLVSPVTWTHYCLTLLVPVVLLFLHLPRSGLSHWFLWGCLVALWVDSALLFALTTWTLPRNWNVIPVKPWQTLTAMSLHTYALAGLFVLGIVAARASRRDVHGGPATT